METKVQIEYKGESYVIHGSFETGLPGNSRDTQPDKDDFVPTKIYHNLKHDFVNDFNDVTAVFDSFDLWDNIDDLIKAAL